MKTPAARSTRPANSKKPKKLKIILGVLVVAIVAASALLIYHNHQNQEKRDQAYNADKAKFAQVETDMQKAYDAIIQATGKPDKEEHSKSCSRTSLKFKKGELWCGVYYKFSFVSSESNMTSDKTSVILGALKKSNFGNNPQKIVGATQINGIDYFGVDLIKNDFSLCALKVEYGGSRLLQYQSQEPYAANFNFECRKQVIKSVYSLEE